MVNENANANNCFSKKEYFYHHRVADLDSSMKKLVQKLLLTLILSGWTVSIYAGEITVVLDDPPPEGTIVLMLFNSANAFGDLRDPTIVKTAVVNESNLYYLKDVPSGEYALVVYLDENNNERIDKNFIGIPKEPIGFSNRYQPKGPPVFSSAAFRISENEAREFPLSLELALGKRGRIGAGLGVIARSSPYRGYNGAVSQVIPAITFRGERLQILGPNIQLGLIGSGKLRLAASGRYRIGVYDEEDSDFLVGMEDRKDTFTAGLSLQGELPGGVDVSARYEQDVLDEIGGGEARLGFDKSFQFGAFRISPEIAVNWLSADFANHDFGVPVGDSLPNRPAYQLDSTTSFEAGLGMFYEITRDWLVVANIGIEFLEDQVTDSPIVEEDYVLKGFFAINYVF